MPGSGNASFWELPPAKGLGELVKRVHELELIASKNAHGLFGGEYASRVPGQGLEFREARKYVYGESIRSIDWNITARMGNPYVRVFQEEREREIYIALDVSPSMHTGWQSRKKIEYAAELAATIAFAAINAGDKLGLITYANCVIENDYPKKGRVQFFRTLRSIYSAATTKAKKSKATDMRCAIHEIEKRTGRNFVIFFISDFIDYDIPDDLAYLRARHDVTLVHVSDPMEITADQEISLPGFSPEGPRKRGVLSPHSVSLEINGVNYFLDATSRFHVKRVAVSTDKPIVGSLSDLFTRMRTWQ